MKLVDKFYYCHGCSTFHRYGTHDDVDRYLCFCCGHKKNKKTRIVGNLQLGYIQVCDYCYHVHGFSNIPKDSIC